MYDLDKKKWAAMKATHSFDNPKTNLTYEKNLYIFKNQISCQILYKDITTSSNKKMFFFN